MNLVIQNFLGGQMIVVQLLKNSSTNTALENSQKRGPMDLTSGAVAPGSRCQREPKWEAK